MPKAKPLKEKVVIVGCGNLAWHLALRLSSLKKYQVLIYNHRAGAHLDEFKKLPDCKTYASLERIATDGDYYLLAVSDGQIARVETKVHLKKPGALILHTSGSTALEALGNREHHSAVFYPLQTFSRRDTIDWEEVPIIIEADNEAVRKQAALFANNFSNQVFFASGAERLRIHLAAVLVNNFTNALYGKALHLLSEKMDEPVPPGLLLPLMRQTVKKLGNMTPEEAQTGPARRGDEVTIEKHLAILKGKHDVKKIYKVFTKLIARQYA